MRNIELTYVFKENLEILLILLILSKLNSLTGIAAKLAGEA